jgi:probable DNA metabolism protein
MMWRADVAPGWSLAAWRAQARLAWEARIAPDALLWEGDAQPGLIAAPPLGEAPRVRSGLVVPAALVELAAAVLCHRDPGRHALLYRALWRIGGGERGLLERPLDPDIHALRAMEKNVRRDVHKMKAFVRFRAVPGHDDAYCAWFEPEHRIVDRVAPFFMRRYAGMRWSILTPYRSATWDGAALWLGPGGRRDDVPADDAGEDLWRTYYASIFNPARLNTRMMRQEMPQKYWHLLPETRLLPQLVREAGARTRAMAERPPQPPRRRLPSRRPGREDPRQG